MSRHDLNGKPSASTAPESASAAGRKRRVGVYLFLLLVAAGVLCAFYRVGPQGPPSREAVLSVGVGEDLLLGLTRGRQGLIGSLRWAPLPTLLVLPLLNVTGAPGSTFGACVVAAVGAACLCVFLSRWWAQYGMREAVRVPIAVALFLSPPLLKPILLGRADPVFAFLVIATLAHFIHWWETEELRSLAYTAVCAGLACLVRYQAVVLPAVLMLLLLGHLVARRKREAYVEGTLITFLVPCLYFVGLWFAANWLIMGDAAFFLRGLAAYRDRGLALAALADPAVWSPCLLPGLIGVLGWGLCRLAGRTSTLWTGLPVLAGCALLWSQGDLPLRPEPPDPAAEQLVRVVVPYLHAFHGQDRVVVSGYRGYEIARQTSSSDIFIHKLSLYLDEALKETRGKTLFLLVPSSERDDLWEDVNLKFPGVFLHGCRGVVFEKAWSDWSLWRVVRLDTPDQIL